MKLLNWLRKSWKPNETSSQSEILVQRFLECRTGLEEETQQRDQEDEQRENREQEIE